MAFIDFIRVVMPALLELAADLFQTFRGDAAQATQEITNYRSTVDALRAKRDAQIEAKHAT